MLLEFSILLVDLAKVLILLPFYETINIFRLEIHIAFTADNVTFVDVADVTIRSLRSTLTHCACATHFIHSTWCTRFKCRTHYTITTTTASHHSISSSSLADQRIMPTYSCRHLLADQRIMPTSSCRHLPLLLTSTRATFLYGGVIGCHLFPLVALGPASPDMRSTPAGFVLHVYQPPPIPSPSQPTIAMTNYTHVPTVMNPSTFNAQL